MKAFVFTSTSEFLGKFAVRDIASVPEELEKYLAANPKIPDFAYVEAFDRTWTVLCRSPFELATGRLPRQGGIVNPTPRVAERQKEVSILPAQGCLELVIILFGIAFMLVLLFFFSAFQLGQ